MKILFLRTPSSSSSKKSTATKELEDLMESLSNFTPPSQVLSLKKNRGVFINFFVQFNRN